MPNQAVRDTKGPLMRISGAILVVEPHHTIAEMISEVLRDEGYAVSIVHDCAGTIASIARQRPALVLLDDHNATLDAAELDTHITQQYRINIPIITTTTNPAVASLLNAREKWACLEEPFTLDTLMAYVTHYVPSTDLVPPN
jgi:CheY-like chemotaxis protein